MKFVDMVKNAALISLLLLVLMGAGLFIYQIVWTITFMNLIEAPLPESEEKTPDLGIVD